jgi:large subunit ribosomal protein L24
MKYKVGDEVIVMAGKDKGTRGKILRVLPTEGKAVVQGVNFYTRHVKPYGGKVGERIRRERPLDISKIAIWNVETSQPDRIGYQLKDGEKIRIYKKTGKKI